MRTYIVQVVKIVRRVGVCRKGAEGAVSQDVAGGGCADAEEGAAHEVVAANAFLCSYW